MHNIKAFFNVIKSFAVKINTDNHQFEFGISGLIFPRF